MYKMTQSCIVNLGRTGLLVAVLLTVVISHRLGEVIVNTPDRYQYQYLGLPAGETSMTFRVKARNDAHIALAPTTDKGNRVYEIVLGGWGNTKSVIRKVKQQRPPRASVYTPSILNSNILKPFWVSWARGHIKVGRGNIVGVNIIMQWLDPRPYYVNYFGVSTGWGSTGKWKITY